MISNNIGAYLPSVRIAPSKPVEQSYTPPVKEAPTPDDVATLSQDERLELSQQADVAPPPPPTYTKKAPVALDKKQTRVETRDFAGRTCSGDLNGPLLMEEATLPETTFGAFKTTDFVLDNPKDFEDLRTASVVLGTLPPETLHASAGDQPLVGGSSFAYFGVKNGMAVLVQHFEGREKPLQAQESSFKLPDGQVAHIIRADSVTLRVPESSLDDLAHWGRSLLAIA